MRRFVVPLIAVLVLAAPSLVMARSVSSVRGQLHELNGSGARGSVTAVLDGTTLTVHVSASGLEDGAHLRHIHGGPAAVAGTSSVQVSKCPTPAADANADGTISVAEGVPDYGAVLIDLGTFATTDGTVDETLTFTGVDTTALGDLDRRAVVVHGMTVNGTYDVTVPVLCGQLHINP